MYYFTADEHYGHDNIIKYCNRPFSSIEEMDYKIISRHNEVIKPGDVVIHGGDFTLKNSRVAEGYVRQLNGKHIFLKGSHDYWLRHSNLQIWTDTIEGVFVVVCHYAMRVWPKSHFNSWQLFGHSHGGLKPIGKQWDIGVDNNNFYPISFSEIKEIMSKQPDNFNFIK